MEVKRCNNCFQIKPILQFSLTKYKTGYRTQCKQCRTEIETRRIMEKKLIKSPDVYRECDNCYKILRMTKKCECEC